MDTTHFIKAAYEEAQLGLSEGGLPIGSVLVDRDGNIVSRGHNLRVQTGDPTAHAEMVAIRSISSLLSSSSSCHCQECWQTCGLAQVDSGVNSISLHNVYWNSTIV